MPHLTTQQYGMNRFTVRGAWWFVPEHSLAEHKSKTFKTAMCGIVLPLVALLIAAWGAAGR